jgi:hypothetical protein
VTAAPLPPSISPPSICDHCPTPLLSFAKHARTCCWSPTSDPCECAAVTFALQIVSSLVSGHQELCVLPTVPALGHTTLLVSGTSQDVGYAVEVLADGSPIQLSNGEVLPSYPLPLPTTQVVVVVVMEVAL